jgi:hypothetical protein
MEEEEKTIDRLSKVTSDLLYHMLTYHEEKDCKCSEIIELSDIIDRHIEYYKSENGDEDRPHEDITEEYIRLKNRITNDLLPNTNCIKLKIVKGRIMKA